MLKIKGKINNAIFYGKTIEEGAIAQLQRMCSYDITKDSIIRIMPDAHEGKGCTIGTTMTINDKACPNIVGVDIGCGMYTLKLLDKKLDFQKIDEVCHFIPSGTRVWDERIERYDLSSLYCYRSLKNTKRLERSLGTLGGGNHFIEIDRSSNGDYYLIIHSGSRNLGKQVASIYQQIAIDLHSGKEDYYIKREEIIKSYKEEGRRSEIQDALKNLEEKYSNKLPNIPDDICWLYGSFLDNYLHDIKICQDFACRNREKIAEIILEKTDMKATETFHTIHNYIDVKEKILRKGAISARSMEKVLIPINMRDGSILAVGKGNPEWNYSAPHGAGRIMSRAKAKDSISIEDYKKSMEGIYTTCINEGTIDESPMAYKQMDEIIDIIKNTVDIVDVIKSVYNFKASYN